MKMSLQVNLLLIVVILVLAWNVVQGYKHGMVKEVISFVSLIVLCLVLGLVGMGIQSYSKKEYLTVIAAVLLLAILGIAHHLLGIVFFSAKMIVKLPLVKWADKLLGVVTGALETVFLLWMLYAVMQILSLGAVGAFILEWTQKSEILSWFYTHNYLLQWIQKLRP